jgi:hypothetical protein
MRKDELLHILDLAVRNGDVIRNEDGTYSVARSAIIRPEMWRSSEGFYTVERPSGFFLLHPINSEEPCVRLEATDVTELYQESCVNSISLPDILNGAQVEMTEYGPVPFIGDGYEAIYVYTTAECKSQGLMKIGMSSSASVRGVVARIKQQFGTSNPSPPEILLVARVEDGFRAEQAIHKQLSSKRLSGPGTEWFKTSLEEVAAAYWALAK